MAGTPGPVIDPASGLTGPFAGAAAFVALLLYVVREWRRGREVDVAAAQARAERAERERDTDVARLQRELAELRGEVAAVREEMRELRHSHDAEIRSLHRQLQESRGREYQLREWIVTGRAVDAALPPGFA